MIGWPKFNCVKKAQLSWAFKSITEYRVIRYMLIAKLLLALTIINERVHQRPHRDV